MKALTEKALAELEVIRKKNKNILNPKDVVKFARSEKTELHKYFEWDNSKAAEEYRVFQARNLIRVVVTVHEETGEKVRAFVSLRNERGSSGGYRTIVDVMSDEDLTNQLLQDAKEELDYFRTKYSSLRKVSELDPVFIAIDKVV